MNKKLAIRGHSTRGNEVIELFEMMGGNNIYNFSGDGRYAYYVIEGCQNAIRAGEYIFGDEDMYLFTLEEFLEKYPFKVGDKVVYTKFGDNCDDYPETIESMKWTGTTIEYTFNDCVTCLAKDLKMWNGEPDAVISGIYLNSCDYADEVELNLGDYKIEVRDGRTFAVKKKPKYPKTYKECCDVLLIPPYYNLRYHTYERGYNEYVTSNTLLLLEDKLNTLGKLIICCKAYWKIAGEEMGLGKPWEPDWQKTEERKFCIIRRNDNVVTKWETKTIVRFLAFPTEKMRDVFYENFKSLIERCKELL